MADLRLQPSDTMRHCEWREMIGGIGMTVTVVV